MFKSRRTAVSLVALMLAAAMPDVGLGSPGINLRLRKESGRYTSPSAGFVSDTVSFIAERPCQEDKGCVSFEIEEGERFFQVTVQDRSKQPIGAVVAGSERTYKVCRQDSRFRIEEGETRLDVRVVPTLCASGQGVPTTGEVALTFADKAKVLDSGPGTSRSGPPDPRS